jgi:diacylglycerol kinase (ATP)
MIAPPVGMLSNPNSGHNRDLYPRVSKLVGNCPSIHHRVTQSAADIPAALHELAQLEVQVLAINGGDGSIAAILGHLLEHNIFSPTPLIVLLPGGTANMTAGDIGVRGNLIRAVGRFCQWCEGDRDTAKLIQKRPLLRVTTDPAAPCHYGMFLGGGAVIQGTEYSHREIHSRGLRDDFSLALGVMRTLWGVFRDDPNFSQHVTVDLAINGGQCRRHDSLILAISTLQRLAFGMRPFWSHAPGAIQITVMEHQCSKFLRTFISIARHRPNSNAIPESGYFSHNADTCELSLQGNLNLDGEIIKAQGRVLIEASPTLEFLKL